MRVFANKVGAVLDTAGGFGPVDPPEGTAIIFTFDEATNSGLARIVGERTEWADVLVTEDTIYVQGNAWRVRPDGDVLNQQKEADALVAKLHDDTQLIEQKDVRALLQLLIPAPVTRAVIPASTGARLTTGGRTPR